jgi:hypothetical protein
MVLFGHAKVQSHPANCNARYQDGYKLRTVQNKKEGIRLLTLARDLELKTVD